MNYTAKTIKTLLKAPESNFSELINAIIAMDKDCKDDYGWEIIHAIENIEIGRYIELLVIDLITHDRSESADVMLYLALWSACVNGDEWANEIQVQYQRLQPSGQNYLVNFLNKLNEEDGDNLSVNIAGLVTRLT